MTDTLELKAAIEASNKLIETLSEKSKPKIAEIEAKLAAEIEAKSALEARLTAIENANARATGLNVKAADTLDTEHKSAFLGFLRNIDKTEAKANLQSIEAKAIEIGVGSTGGFAVPRVISNEIARAALDKSTIRQISRQVTTSTSDYSEIVTSGTGAGWAGEDDVRATTASATFTKAAPTFGEVFAVVEVSNHALNDVMFNLEAFIIEEAAAKFAEMEGAAFATGNGTDKPTGLLNGTTISTIKTGAAADFGANPYDNLIDLMYSVKGAYRQNGSWLMNSSTMSKLAKVKDTQGNYIYQPALAAGVPDTLLGKPVYLDEGMPSVGAGAKVVLFGDFSRGYLIADLGGMTIIPDQVTKKGYTIFYVSKRVGGTVKDASALKALVCSA